MDAPSIELEIPAAGTPLTFRGVASFADASLTWLGSFQFLVALLTGISVLTLFELAWRPSVEAAMESLSGTNRIHAGFLEWNGQTPMRLGTGSFLSFVIDPRDERAAGRPTDVEIVLGEDSARVRSLLGQITVPYPKTVSIDLSPSAARPWWGAWHLFLLVGLSAGAVLLVAISWVLLAAAYAPFLLVFCFYTDRRLTPVGAWKLAAAALLPGALCLDAAVLAYAFGFLGLLQLLVLWILHLVIGWLFVLGGGFRRPRIQQPHRPEKVFSVPPDNPFTRC